VNTTFTWVYLNRFLGSTCRASDSVALGGVCYLPSLMSCQETLYNSGLPWTRISQSLDGWIFCSLLCPKSLV
jgi:hypothetical protein